MNKSLIRNTNNNNIVHLHESEGSASFIESGGIHTNRSQLVFKSA